MGCTSRHTAADRKPPGAITFGSTVAATSGWLPTARFPQSSPLWQTAAATGFNSTPHCCCFNGRPGFAALHNTAPAAVAVQTVHPTSRRKLDSG
jgi:hypothetical protein